MIFEKRNREIDELAYSIKNDKLSDGQRSHKEYLLYSRLFECKGIKIDTVEVQYYNCKKMVLADHISEAYVAAWRDYVKENTTFIKTSGSFSHMFNIYLKNNMKDYHRDVVKLESGNGYYAAKESRIKYFLKCIIQDSGIKDFEMPRNVMNKKLVIELLEKKGISDKAIEQMEEVYNDANFVKTSSSKKNGNIMVPDKNDLEELILKVKTVCGQDDFTKTNKYTVCFLSLKIAKETDWKKGKELYGMDKYIDWDFIDRYRDTIEINDIQFVADYMKVKKGTAQKNLKKIKDIFKSTK